MIDDNDIKKLKTIFATREDLMKLEGKMEIRFPLKSDLNKAKQELLERIDEKYYKIFDLVDGLAGEIRDSRESRAIFSYRIEDLEKRVRTLEE